MVNEIYDSLGYLLNTAARLIKWECNNKLKEYDITTAQWAVMKDIYTQKQNKKEANRRKETFRTQATSYG